VAKTLTLSKIWAEKRKIKMSYAFILDLVALFGRPGLSDVSRQSGVESHSAAGVGLGKGQGFGIRELPKALKP